MGSSVVFGRLRVRRATVRIAAVASVLAGTVMVLAPASSAAGSAYAVTEVRFGPFVQGVAADPATSTVYAATGQPAGLAVVDGASGKVEAQIKTNPVTPNTVAVDQASDTVYAISSGALATAVVINGATDAITTSISLPSGLESNAAAANPVTHMVYVADNAHDTVVVIDGHTDAVATTIPLADPVSAPHPLPL